MVGRPEEASHPAPSAGFLWSLVSGWLEGVEDGIAVIEAAEKRVAWANGALHDLLGYEGGLEGLGLAMVWADGPRVLDALGTHARTWRGLARMTQASGQVVQHSVEVTSVADAQGETAGFVVRVEATAVGHAPEAGMETGVRHQVNNLLASALATLELVRRRSREAETVLQVGQARRALERAVGLLARLRPRDRG